MFPSGIYKKPEKGVKEFGKIHLLYFENFLLSASKSNSKKINKKISSPGLPVALLKPHFPPQCIFKN